MHESISTNHMSAIQQTSKWQSSCGLLHWNRLVSYNLHCYCQIMYQYVCRMRCKHTLFTILPISSWSVLTIKFHNVSSHACGNGLVLYAYQSIFVVQYVWQYFLNKFHFPTSEIYNAHLDKYSMVSLCY